MYVIIIPKSLAWDYQLYNSLLTEGESGELYRYLQQDMKDKFVRFFT